MTSLRLRALSIGSGWGRHAAHVFSTDPRTELGGIVGRGSARTEALAARLAVPVFGSLTEAVAAVRPQLASVAVHHSSNFRLVDELLSAGCHVLCSHPVAPTGAEVLRLAERARARGLVVATDYTLRLQPGFKALLDARAAAGVLLRLSLESPGSTSVMAVDLALALAGPVELVRASRRYPPEIRDRVRERNRAFAPTFLLEHRTGCVSVITPVPHADPAAAYRLVLSHEHARLEAALPAGAVDWLAYRGSGLVERKSLLGVAPPKTPEALYGDAMEQLVGRFVSACLGEMPPHATFEEEARTCEAWNGLRQSAHRDAEVRIVIG